MPDDPDLESAYALKTPDDNRRLYRDWAETYDDDFVSATGYRFPRVVADMYDQDAEWPCLDVGCGTGAVAEAMRDVSGPDAVIDGVDLSPEMLEVARQKNVYRDLIEANLKEPLRIEDARYAGIVSSGTFTHGHVGPEALDELVRILRPGGRAILTVRPAVWEELRFADSLAALRNRKLISEHRIDEQPVYADGRGPEGHENDTGYILSFTRT